MKKNFPMKKIFPFSTNFPYLPTNNMADSYAEQEARISRALEDYTSGKNQNLSALAREYRVTTNACGDDQLVFHQKISNQNRPRPACWSSRGCDYMYN
jgi:hypothetical protein